MDKKIRWGILGPGGIARKFAASFGGVVDGELYAVGSRSIEKANSFADEFKIPKRYGSYEDLVSDPEVDAIYVATPHPFHRPNTLLCLKGGKAVLCEKPMAINAGEVREMVECARGNKAFLMEAMWTRFLPIYKEIDEWISKGLIGQIKLVTADFGFRAEPNPKSRLFDPNLGGGALLDVGVYVISFASLFMGTPPINVSGILQFGETGVDEQASVILGYEGGRMAVLYNTIKANTNHEARIFGTEGSIHIPSFWNATTATLKRPGEDDKTINIAHIVNGYCNEINEVNRCIREGRLQSDRMPWDESISIIETMDKVREQWGFKYPME